MGNVKYTSNFIIEIFFCAFPQLDLCSKMAGTFTWTSTGSTLQFPLHLGMDNCCFSCRSAYLVGILVDLDTWTGYNWFSCNNGWHCSSFGILFDNALVENPMAKLKYVLY